MSPTSLISVEKRIKKNKKKSTTADQHNSQRSISAESLYKYMSQIYLLVKQSSSCISTRSSNKDLSITKWILSSKELLKKQTIQLYWITSNRYTIEKHLT